MKYIILFLIAGLLSAEVPREDRGIYKRGNEQIIIDRNHIAKDGKIERIREVKATKDGYEVNGVKIQGDRAIKRGKAFDKKANETLIR
jgi:hypothetical protein